MFFGYPVISMQYILTLSMTNLHWEIWLVRCTQLYHLCGSPLPKESLLHSKLELERLGMRSEPNYFSNQPLLVIDLQGPIPCNLYFSINRWIHQMTQNVLRDHFSFFKNSINQNHPHLTHEHDQLHHPVIPTAASLLWPSHHPLLWSPHRPFLCRRRGIGPYFQTLA